MLYPALLCHALYSPILCCLSLKWTALQCSDYSITLLLLLLNSITLHHITSHHIRTFRYLFSTSLTHSLTHYYFFFSSSHFFSNTFSLQTDFTMSTQADVCTDAMIVERSQLYETSANRCTDYTHTWCSVATLSVNLPLNHSSIIVDCLVSQLPLPLRWSY